MHIRRLRVVRHADCPHTPLTAQTKTQHDDHWQRQAIRPQLHGLPAMGGTPQLPAIGITAQTGKRRGMSQQNLPRQRPQAMGQAQRNAGQARPDRYREKSQRTQREQLGQKISRQQLP